MAIASTRLVSVLRQTAVRLTDASVTYRWSSFAHCNCGHVAQSLTQLSPEEIQARAMRREGDWATQANELPLLRPDYGTRPALDEGAWEPENVGACRATGERLDGILDAMLELGLDPQDITHLERLSDPEVRRRLGNNTEYFAHHVRENVIAYLAAWADLLEARLLDAAVPSPGSGTAQRLPLAAE
jgi:hypothetical protein